MKALEALGNALRGLRLWQFVALAAVLFGSAGAVYAGYNRAVATPKASLGENQQLVPARTGDLVNQVSTSGSVAFPNKRALTLGAAGTVDEVLVEAGQLVTEGQPLVRFNAATVANLKQGMAQAQLDLAEAQNVLDDLQAEYATQLADASSQLAQSRQEVEIALDALAGSQAPYAAQQDQAKTEAATLARIALRDAQATWDNLMGDMEQQLAQARQTEAAARQALTQAENDLANLAVSHAQALAQARQAQAEAALAAQGARLSLDSYQTSYQREFAQAQEAQATASLALQTARDKLADFETGYLQRLAEAQEAEANASQALSAAQSALDSYLSSSGRLVSAAEEAVEEVNERLDYARQQLVALEASAAAGTHGLEGQLQQQRDLVADLEEERDKAEFAIARRNQLQAARDASEAALKLARAEAARLSAGPDAAEKSQLEAASQVAERDLELADRELARLAPGPDRAEKTRLEAAMRQAEAELMQANFNLAQAQRAPTPADIAAQEAAAAAAAAFVEEARADGPAPLELAQAMQGYTEAALAALRAGVNPETVAAQLAETQTARAALTTATASRHNLESRFPDPLETEARRVKLELAKAALAQAEKDLADHLKNAPLEVAVKEKAVTLAQARQQQAEQALARLEAHGGPDPRQLALRQALLEAAQVNYDEAARRWANAPLKSPVTGLVSQVGVVDGEQVSANTLLVEVADTSSIEILGTIAEIDALSVAEGMTASVTMDALPGRVLTGRIVSVAAAAQTSQGVVNYPITIQVDLPEGVQLREGLSATASIVLSQQPNVLLVPQQSIYGTVDSPVVKVMRQGRLQEQLVELGGSDGAWVAVRQGLAPGEQVLMDIAQVSTSGNLFSVTGGGGAFRGGPPGGAQRAVPAQQGR